MHWKSAEAHDYLLNITKEFECVPQIPYDEASHVQFWTNFIKNLLSNEREIFIDKIKNDFTDEWKDAFNLFGLIKQPVTKFQSTKIQRQQARMNTTIMNTNRSNTKNKRQVSGINNFEQKKDQTSMDKEKIKKTNNKLNITQTHDEKIIEILKNDFVQTTENNITDNANTHTYTNNPNNNDCDDIKHDLENSVQLPKKRKTQLMQSLTEMMKSQIIFQPPLFENKRLILFAGLYPPAKSNEFNEYDNRTSKVIEHQLGHQDFHWVDLFLFNATRCKDVNLHELEKLCTPEVRSQWKDRLGECCMNIPFNQIPVIYVCGQICERQWDILSLESVKIENQCGKKIFIVQIHEQKTAICFIDCHPSAALHRPEKRGLLQENMLILNFLALHANEILHSKSVDLKGIVSEYRIEQCARVRTFLTKIGVSDTDPCKQYLEYSFTIDDVFTNDLDRIMTILKQFATPCSCKRETCHKDHLNCQWEQMMQKLCKKSVYHCFWGFLKNYNVKEVFLFLLSRVSTPRTFFRLVKSCKSIGKLLREKSITIEVIHQSMNNLSPVTKNYGSKLLLNSGFYLGVNNRNFLQQLETFLNTSCASLCEFVVENEKLMIALTKNQINFNEIHNDFEIYSNFAKLYNNPLFFECRKVLDEKRQFWDLLFNIEESSDAPNIKYESYANEINLYYDPESLNIYRNKQNENVTTLLESKHFIQNIDNVKFLQYMDETVIDIERMLSEQKKRSDVSARSAIRFLLQCDTFCYYPRNYCGTSKLFQEHFNNLYEHFANSQIAEHIDVTHLTVSLCATDNFVHEHRTPEKLFNCFMHIVELFTGTNPKISYLIEVINYVKRFFQTASFGRKIVRDNYSKLFDISVKKCKFDTMLVIFTSDFFNEQLFSHYETVEELPVDEILGKIQSREVKLTQQATQKHYPCGTCGY